MTISTSKTVTIDLEARKGDIFNFPFVVLDDLEQPVDLSLYTSAKMSIRTNENSTNPVYSFTSTGGTINVDGMGSGSFIVDCDELTIDAGSYLYDFEVRTSTRRLTVLSGKFIVTADVTK